jgi:hypothetical protein
MGWRHAIKRERIRRNKAKVRKEHPRAICRWHRESGGFFAVERDGFSKPWIVQTGRTRNEAWARAAGAWPVQVRKPKGRGVL